MSRKSTHNNRSFVKDHLQLESSRLRTFDLLGACDEFCEHKDIGAEPNDEDITGSKKQVDQSELRSEFDGINEIVFAFDFKSDALPPGIRKRTTDVSFTVAVSGRRVETA